MIPDDLTDEHIDALRQKLDVIAEPEFRARVGDVLWVRSRDAQAGRVAVDAYLASGFSLEDPVHWVDGMERYERAIRLAAMLDQRGSLFVRIADHILDRVRFYNGADQSWLSHRGLSLLYEFRHGDPLELAGLAAKSANFAGDKSDTRRAWEHHELEAKFYRRAGEEALAINALRARAERMVDHAEAKEADSFLVAHTFWNDAIQAYRRVPGSAERIRQLHQRLNIAGEKMHGEMKSFNTEIDISNHISHARNLLEGTTFEDAMCGFAIVANPIDPVQHRAFTEQLINKSPLQGIMEASIMDIRGHKVDVRPSAMTDDPEQYERAILGFTCSNSDLI